jgi:AcrR family transcriptional regulator
MPCVTTTTRTRLTPDQRRGQLLDLGVRLLATRSLDELSIDLLAEEAGISRGLLYHYFGGKRGFYEAVVRHAAADLFAKTAPPPDLDPLDKLEASMAAYVDYVIANHAGYRSLVKAAAGGNEALRRVYEETQAAIGERIFAEDDGILVADRPAQRLVVRGWLSFVEETVLNWCEDPRGVSKEQLLGIVTASLPALVAAIPG